jgi:hypothetical protein
MQAESLPKASSSHANVMLMLNSQIRSSKCSYSQRKKKIVAARKPPNQRHCVAEDYLMVRSESDSDAGWFVAAEQRGPSSVQFFVRLAIGKNVKVVSVLCLPNPWQEGATVPSHRFSCFRQPEEYGLTGSDAWPPQPCH